jgi:hopene-associated glycosyltransferase HpnB
MATTWDLAVLLGTLGGAIWFYLAFFRGAFWRPPEALPPAPGPLGGGAAWPAVTALVPARNEAAVIAASLASLLAQDYPGRLSIVVIDDASEDDTAALARRVASPESARSCQVVQARPLPAGWTGKLWALAEGLGASETETPPAQYLWLSDADIAAAPDTLTRQVAKAREGFALVSLLARLSCRSPWERLLIPPFVYFFRLIYPFAWVAAPERPTAAAAGGSILVDRRTLERVGGFAALRDQVIDDCALARAIKQRGGRPIWLGLGQDLKALRGYEGLEGIWRMVARNAYAQLRYGPHYLLLAALGLAVTFLAPPLLVLAWPWHGSVPGALFGLLAWGLMMATYAPTLRDYDQPLWQAATLPLAAALYGAMTLESAWRHHRGRGNPWKGRAPSRKRDACTTDGDGDTTAAGAVVSAGESQEDGAAGSELEPDERP